MRAHTSLVFSTAGGQSSQTRSSFTLDTVAHHPPFFRDAGSQCRCHAFVDFRSAVVDVDGAGQIRPRGVRGQRGAVHGDGRHGASPKGKPGKFSSPQRGTTKKGYRLDPPHPNAKPGSAEEGWHINWWDWTEGKRGTGGRYGAVKIDP